MLKPLGPSRRWPEGSARVIQRATATVGDAGWVDLAEPIIMRAGEAFIAVPEATTEQ